MGKRHSSSTVLVLVFVLCLGCEAYSSVVFLQEDSKATGSGWSEVGFKVSISAFNTNTTEQSGLDNRIDWGAAMGSRAEGYRVG